MARLAPVLLGLALLAGSSSLARPRRSAIDPCQARPPGFAPVAVRPFSPRSGCFDAHAPGLTGPTAMPVPPWEGAPPGQGTNVLSSEADYRRRFVRWQPGQPPTPCDAPSGIDWARERLVIRYEQGTSADTTYVAWAGQGEGALWVAIARGRLCQDARPLKGVTSLAVVVPKGLPVRLPICEQRPACHPGP